MFKELLNDYMNWWKVWGTRPVLCWIRGASLFRASAFREASELYESGLEKLPDHIASDCARLDLAYCYFQLEQIDDAIKTLDAITSKEVNLPEAYILHGRLLVFIEDITEALEVLRVGVEVHPNNPRILAHYALYAWRYDRDLLNTKAILNKLRKFSENLVWESADRQLIETAIAAYSRAYLGRDAAEETLCRVLASGFASEEAYLLRADIFAEKSQMVFARDHYNRAMRLAAVDPRAVIGLAQSYMVGSHPSGFSWAKALLLRACQLSQYKNPSAMLLLADVERAESEEDASQIMELYAYLLKSERDIHFHTFENLNAKLEQLRNL